jgi:CubicO group peptidase (beta-lactamase class C family)
MIRRLAVASVLLAVALPLLAQPAAPTCAKTLGITWADIKQCMSELTVRYPDQFSDAVFGYLPAGSATPVVGFAGSAFGNETDYNTDPAKDKILWQGSISKVFTHSMTLLAMERAGRSLDERFGDFNLAAHANFIDGDAYGLSKQRKVPLTVRQILTMTAGFKEMTYNELENHHLRGSDPSFWSAFPSAAACFQQATGRTDPNTWFLLEPGIYNECMWVPSLISDQNSAKTWKPARTVPLWNVAQYTMRYPVTFDPVDPNVYPFKYSNTASIFGAFITESLTGQTFNTYAKTNFLQPLGMTDTFYNPTTLGPPPLDKENEGVTTDQQNRIAHMLNKANGVRDTNVPPVGLAPCNGSYWCDRRDWNFTWPEGGLYASPRNIFRFLRALRDRTLPNFSPAMYDLALHDQLAENQTWAGSRTAVFAYMRNGQAGFVEGETEGTVLHGGYPGTYAVYDPNRQLAWYFGVQRVMRHHPYFQAGGETFAEARQFSVMLTSMLENQKSDNINFFFDAARAAKRNQSVLRYQSRVPPNTNWSDAYTACANQGDNGNCEYNIQVDYNSCGTTTENSWYDLGPYQRTMTVSGGACAWWPGTGSYTENGPGHQQNGPFRLSLLGNVTANVKSNLYPNSYSVALWVRANSTANASIISRAGAAAYNYKTTYQIGIENGHFVHSSRDSAGAKHTVVGPAVNAGQWYYVVGRATKNGVMSLFVNDVKVGGDVPIGDFVSIAGYDYNLGSAADGLGTFGGDVAVAAVYTQELSPAEIQRNCNGMKYRFPGASCQ